ncbi:hypothetical protein D1AOALGA4SA_13079 [Olavius algarvensis Delta 1 endosymbiont]|nr:hypothetical protein D1AOALGA4SA_13079 [Olavius algarvensis Delta 1 endosymbiont]
MVSKPQKNPSLPPISVIILTFNGAEYISQLMESLADQTYPSDLVEIIVVDNASIDDTAGIIRRSYPFVNLVVLEKNVGFAGGNNQGLLQANHGLLVFLNQDTICHPKFLTSLVNTILSDKTLAACNPNIITPNPLDVSSIDIHTSPETLFVCDLSPYGYGKNRILKGTPIYYPKLLSGCAFIIRRETVSKLGYLFDERIWMYAEDTDLSLRIHNTGQKVCASRESIIYHLHDTKANINMTRLRLAGQAIMNRVYIFYKNMNGLEFLIFFPFLWFGGIFKIFEFSMPSAKKAIYFLPFGLFSMVCMILALFQIPRFAVNKKLKLEHRRLPEFSLLKRILKV